MKNIETVKVTEAFDDTVFDHEDFPIKDRSKAVRRKKTYFKGKNRLSRICKARQYSKDDSVYAFDVRARGMLKKTNVIAPHFDPDPLLSINLKAICRDLDTKEMISDYYEEAI